MIITRSVTEEDNSDKEDEMAMDLATNVVSEQIIDYTDSENEYEEDEQLILDEENETCM